MIHKKKAFERLPPHEFEKHLKKERLKSIGYLVLFGIFFGYTLYMFDYSLAILLSLKKDNIGEIVNLIVLINMIFLWIIGYGLNVISYDNAVFTGPLAEKGTWKRLHGNTKWEHVAAKNGSGMYYFAEAFFNFHEGNTSRGRYLWVFRIIIITTVIVSVKIFKTF